MKILIADQAGFCTGVHRAIKLAERAIAQQPVRSLGPLIHNVQEVERLKKKGIIFTEEEIPNRDRETDEAVLIRSHGVGPQVMAALEQAGWPMIDATCPYVKKAQKLAAEAAAEGYQVIILGDQEHAEVKGLQEWAGGKAIVVSSAEELKGIALTPPVALLAQTTEREARFDEAAEYLRNATAEPKIHKTICKATEQRQKAAGELAGQVDLMLVVGGRHSSNTTKLWEICQSVNKNSRLIEEAKEIDRAWLKNINSVGITAGASTPAWIIKEVVMSIEENKEQEQSLEQME
ncbi:MAG: 4-hydroxy-3-methylbut-2-enyl diphosphate reductase, partial [Clostridia bacterium]|nr:4-hydroxy-3-methylbut-2-enyl diphosphate reductase [Clostridia bacterium]